jgi:hypothetical protein
MIEYINRNARMAGIPAPRRALFSKLPRVAPAVQTIRQPVDVLRECATVVEYSRHNARN